MISGCISRQRRARRRSSTPTGQALTRERLEEALGADGEVFATATAYRKAIDAQLFKLGEQRYRWRTLEQTVGAEARQVVELSA